MAEVESTLPRLRHESLAQRAYTELKQAILAGRLEPGKALAEIELAEALGVSRTPVREALAQLRADGLVEALPGGSNAVRALSSDEVRELFLLREALETLAVREYVRTQRDHDELTALLDRQRRAQKSADVEDFLAADEEFHLAVCTLAGLPQVARILSSLREQMRQAGLRAVAQPDRMGIVIREHEAIIAGLKKNKAREASDALLAHLGATRTAFEASNS